MQCNVIWFWAVYERKWAVYECMNFVGDKCLYNAENKCKTNRSLQLSDVSWAVLCLFIYVVSVWYYVCISMVKGFTRQNIAAVLKIKEKEKKKETCKNENSFALSVSLCVWDMIVFARALFSNRWLSIAFMLKHMYTQFAHLLLICCAACTCNLFVNIEWVENCVGCRCARRERKS